MISEIPGPDMWCGVVWYDDVTYLVLVMPPLSQIIVSLHNNGELI